MATISQSSTNVSNSAIANFSVGQLVDVASRTWPGINKHGGVGRIVRLTENCVDVHYVLGGRERGVPIEYVSLLPQAFSSRKSLRDRSILLGRCRNCGSLRADCGSCDFQELNHNATMKDRSLKRIQEAVTTSIPISDQLNDPSSSSEEAILSSVKNQKLGANLKNSQQQSLWDSSDDNNSARSENDSESSENDDQYLKALQKSARIRRNKILLNRLERTTRPKSNEHDKSNSKILRNDRKVEYQSRIGISIDHEEPNPLMPKLRNSSNMAQSLEGGGDEDFDSSDTSDSSVYDKTDIINLNESQSDISMDSHDKQKRPARSFLRTGSKVSHQPGTLLFENDLDGFIQPEGVATLAPRDREDKTLDIPFAELPQMFDQTLQRVTVAFPDALAAWSNLQRRADIRISVGGLLSDLEAEGWKLYDSARENLLFSGLDQCRYMFRRLNSRKEFQRHQDILSRAQKRLFKRSARMLRDVLFDKTEKDVEDFLREVRQYLGGLKYCNKVDGDLKGDESEQSDFSSNLLRQNSMDQEMYRDSELSDLPDFDPHLHARKRVRRRSSNDFQKGEDKHRPRQMRKRKNVEGFTRGQNTVRNPASNRGAVSRRNSAVTDDFIENAAQGMVQHHSKNKGKRKQRINVNEENTNKFIRNKNRALGGENMQSFSPNDVTNDDILEDQTLDLSASATPISRRLHEPNADRLPLDENAFVSLNTLDQNAIDKYNVSRALSFIQSLCRSESFENIQLQRIKKIPHADISNEDKILIFSLIQGYLNSNPETLQELVVIDFDRFSRHVDALTAILTLLNDKLYPQINSIEEDSFRFFLASNGSRPSPFVQFLILQVLDVLFAYSNRKAWATEEILYPVDVTTILSPLRDSLSSLLPLMEISCNYILERLACQEWHKYGDGSKWFISSVNPNSYRLFLKTGDVQQSIQDKVRFKKFKSMIPRVEISTMWFIMGFLAGSVTRIASSKSSSQWKLLHRMLFCDTGVLPRALEVNGNERSSVEHLTRCEFEIDFLILLMSSGTLSPLDGTDRILVHVIKRLVLLQEKTLNNESYLFCKNKERVQNERIRALWNATFHEKEDLNLKTFESGIFLMSGLIQKGIDLLELWLRQTRDKPVLWNQLDSSIRNIQEFSSENHTSHTKDNNNFATSFATHSHERDSFIRDALVAITTTLSMLKQKPFSHVSRPRISLTFITNIWLRFATTDMKVNQERIYESVDSPKSEFSSDSSSSQSTYLLAIRSISIFILAHLGIQVQLSTNTQDERSTNAIHIQDDCVRVEYILYYGMTCLSASWTCFCESVLKYKKLNETNETSAEFAQKMTGALSWIFQVVDACRLLHKKGTNGSKPTEEPYKELHIVGRSVLKLWAGSFSASLIVLLSMSEIGEMETFFRLFLTTLRTLCAWITDAVIIDQSDEDDELIDDLEYSAVLVSNERNDTCNLHRLLIDLLIASNPSCIYSVTRQLTAGKQVIALNSQSRLLLSKFSSSLCACTASLISTNTCDIHSFISGNIGYRDEDSHQRYLWFCLLNEISKLGSKLSLCKRFIRNASKTLALSFLSMTIDPDSLERFSSCDHERLVSLSGEKRALKEREQLRIDEGADSLKSETHDALGPNYVKQNLWECFRNLPKVFLDVSASDILYQRFTSTSCPSSFSNFPSLHKRSLEMECLRRLYFLRQFLKFEDPSHLNESFEQTILFIVKTAVFNLLKISEGLKYYSLQHHRISVTEKTLFSRKHGKLVVLQKCYIEMFTGLFCTSMLGNWCLLSQELRDGLSSILESLFFSLSLHEENDVEDCFCQFVGIPRSANTAMHRSSTLTELSQVMKFACLRRSRQFLQHLVTKFQITDRHRGVIAVLTKCFTFSNYSCIPQEYVLTVTTKAFVLSSLNSFERIKPQFLIERCIDEFFIKEDMISDQKDVDDGIRELRVFALTKIISSKLRNYNEKQFQLRSVMIRQVNELLYFELKDSGTKGLHYEGILNFIDLMRSIWYLMRETLFSSTEVSDILSLIFRCISLILALPIQQDSCSGSNSSLIAWAQLRSLDAMDDGRRILSDARIDGFACFVLTYAAIVYHVASAILNPKSESQIVFEFLKAPEITPNEESVYVLIPSQLLSPITIAGIFTQFHHVTSILLTEIQENRSLAKNAYVKKAPSFDSVSFNYDNLSVELLSEAANLKASIQSIL